MSKTIPAMTQAIDRFLGLSLAAVMNGTPVPPWPDTASHAETWAQATLARIDFHGIALALLHSPDKLADWPVDIREAIGETARGQSFWEMGHKETLLHLLDALSGTTAMGFLTKGTALAYSAYPEPAVRRRGDSDLLLGEVPREPVRAALHKAGFERAGDVRPLQESWGAHCRLGFFHVFDLHWRINASAMLTQRLEAAGIGTRSVPLPRLSQTAKAIAPSDNLILVAVNRASHETFGYRSGLTKLFDQDRLMWALDMDLLTKGFTTKDWRDLLAVTAASGTASLVRSALAYAQATLGTTVPPTIAQELDLIPEDEALLHYFGTMSGIDRLRYDLAASPTAGAKLRLIGYTLFPGREVLDDRFPDLTHWPLAALQVRRLGAAVSSLLQRR